MLVPPNHQQRREFPLWHGAFAHAKAHGDLAGGGADHVADRGDGGGTDATHDGGII